MRPLQHTADAATGRAEALQLKTVAAAAASCRALARPVGTKSRAVAAPAACCSLDYLFQIVLNNTFGASFEKLGDQVADIMLRHHCFH